MAGPGAWMLALAAQRMGTMPMASGGDRVAAPAAPAGRSAAACPATPAALPAAYAGWTAAVPLPAATDAASAPVLTAGRGARVALAEAGAVRFAVAPGHPPAAGSHGGIVALAVPAAGRYRIALDAGAWIDLVRDGAAVRSVAHAHGPVCTAIRKTVDFDLVPGRYLIQLSGTAAPTIEALALRVAE